MTFNLMHEANCTVNILINGWPMGATRTRNSSELPTCSRINDAYPFRIRMRAATRSADRYSPYRSERMDYE